MTKESKVIKISDFKDRVPRKPEGGERGRVPEFSKEKQIVKPPCIFTIENQIEAGPEELKRARLRIGEILEHLGDKAVIQRAWLSRKDSGVISLHLEFNRTNLSLKSGISFSVHVDLKA